MPGFSESQMNMDLDPAERPRILEGPERELELKKQRALNFIGAKRPKEALNELNFVPADAFEGGEPDAIAYSRAEDLEKHITELIYLVPFRQGEPAEVLELKPESQSFQATLQGKKRMYT